MNALSNVSPDTVQRLKKLYYETGGIEPRAPHIVHAHAVSPEGELYLQALLLDKPDLTLGELCDNYEEIYGVRVGVTTMHETLKRLGYSYKKKTFYDPKKDSNQNKDEKLDGQTVHRVFGNIRIGCSSHRQGVAHGQPSSPLCQVCAKISGRVRGVLHLPACLFART